MKPGKLKQGPSTHHSTAPRREVDLTAANQLLEMGRRTLELAPTNGDEKSQSEQRGHHSRPQHHQLPEQERKKQEEAQAGGFSRTPTPQPLELSSALPTGLRAPLPRGAVGSSVDMGRLQVALLSGITVVMAVLVGAAFLASVTALGSSVRRCTSAACNRHRALLAECLNESVHPCRDFYGHVCSRWDAAQDGPLAAAVYQQFMTKVATRALHLSVPPKEQTAAQKAAGLYQSCALVYINNVSHITEVLGLLAAFGIHWPQLSKESRLLSIFLSMSASWSWASVLQFMATRRGHVNVRPSSFYASLLRQRQLMVENDAEHKFYKEYYNAMVATFTQSVAKTTLSFDQLMELENRIVLNLSTALSIPYSNPLENITSAAIANLSSNVYSAGEWEKQLGAMFNAPEHGTFTFTVEYYEFFQHFFELVAFLGESTMAYYIGWVVAQALSLLASRQLTALYFLSDTWASRGHMLFCAEVTYRYVGVALLAEHLRREVTEDVLNDVLSVESTVQAIFRERLTGSTWASSVPRNVLEEEWLEQSLPMVNVNDAEALEDMDQHVPDMGDNVFENIRLVTEHRRPNRVNASAIVSEDIGNAHISIYDHARFALLPVALEMPLYGVDALPATKYAILGNEVVYALSSVVLDNVRTYNSRLQVTFTHKLICFFNRQVLLSRIDPHQMQLIKRVTSVRTLLSALTNASGNGRPTKLLGYEALTDAQMLLIFWCIVHCGSRDGRRMCNAPLALVEGFAEAFHCEHGEAMKSGRDCAAL
ncbi:neprilysin-1-like [Rhipicephalus microplus]|uniref:neprilysin-1-like n=1 Tax=Rhipicephalus microplus TaxID=6941 RepID=UPI003F6D9DA5